jgi:hypothetical protein
VLARTDMTSCNALRAVSDVSPGSRIASSNVGIVWSIALAPRYCCMTSNVLAAADRTVALLSTSADRTAEMIASWWSSTASLLAATLHISQILTISRIDLHDIGESKTCTFFRTWIGGGDGFLQDRDQFREDPLSILPT